MYLSAFGLKSKPFSIAPDAEKIVWTDAARTVRNRLKSAIDSHIPTVALIGNVGSGKTLLILSLLRDGFSPGTQVVFLRSFFDTTDALLKMVAEQVADPAGPETSALTRIASAARSAPLVVILDEAQGAAPDAVRELDRVARDADRMTLLLVGQPELGQRLRGSEYSTLKIPSDCLISMPLPTEDEAKAYVSGRLTAAGGTPDLIAPDAAVLIARAAQRVPRLMNKIADACLFLAASEGRSRVDAAFAADVIQHDLDPKSLAMSPRAFAKMPELSTPSKNARPPVSALPAKQDKASPAPADPVPSTITPAPRFRSAMRITAALAIVPVGIAAVLLWSDPESISIRDQPAASQPLSQEQTATDVREIPPDQPVVVPSTDVATLDPAEASTETIMALFEKALAEDDPRRSAIEYARAASLGHRRSARYIAQKFDTGDGVIFSTDMAARWYAVADGADPAGIPITGNSLEVAPLLGVRTAGRLDLVWDGSADMFEVDLADADLKIIGRIETPLTAISVVGPPGAENWRVLADGADVVDWQPLVN